MKPLQILAWQFASTRRMVRAHYNRAESYYYGGIRTARLLTTRRPSDSTKLVRTRTCRVALPTYQKKDYGKAITDFTGAIRLNPDHFTVYAHRGMAYERIGEYEKAIADFSTSIRQSSGDRISYHGRADCYSAVGNLARAVADYTEVIRLDPKDARAFNDRGVAHENKGNHDKAIADYTEAIRLDPNVAAAYYNRGFARGQKCGLRLGHWRLQPGDQTQSN